jgi:anti-sigma regulatory factor (Ser/Thr protein kinase)
MGPSPITQRRLARIACGIDAPAEARRWAGWLADAVDQETAEAIMVVVSELVTNAVRHARLAPGDPIELSGEVRGDRVSLTVRDRGTGLPSAPPSSLPPPDAGGSRGLYLVAHLAARVLMDPPEGAVTCEFAR